MLLQAAEKSKESPEWKPDWCFDNKFFFSKNVKSIKELKLAFQRFYYILAKEKQVCILKQPVYRCFMNLSVLFSQWLEKIPATWEFCKINATGWAIQSAQSLIILTDTTWSVRVRSFTGPYFPAFGLNKRYSGCGKIRTWKTPSMDTFHAVWNPIMATHFTYV